MRGAVTGSVRGLLRLEGLCVLAVAARVGAVAYNAAHSYVGAVLGLAGALVFPAHVPVALGLIWCRRRPEAPAARA
jgi:hypothetical protein